jgi:hypothetical protein
MAASYLHITPKVGESYTTSADATPQDPTYSFWRTNGRPTAQWTRQAPGRYPHPDGQRPHVW